MEIIIDKKECLMLVILSLAHKAQDCNGRPRSLQLQTLKWNCTSAAAAAVFMLASVRNLWSSQSRKIDKGLAGCFI